MPPRPEAILLVLAPFAPLFSPRVWRHAQGLLLGAMLAPGARTVTAACRGMGRAPERGVTPSQRVVNRATGSARPGRRLLLEWRITWLVPAGATLGLGADDPVERRRGRKSTATGCSREAGRSTQKHVSRCFGLTWGSLRRLVPGPWAPRVWARPVRTALCRPAKQKDQRRHKTRVEWGRQMITRGRRWLPGRRVGLAVAGGLAAVALACVQHQVVMVARWRWDAALWHRPGPPPPGTRGPTPVQGKRPRGLPTWAARAATPWEAREIDGYGGPRQQLGSVSPTA